VAELTTVRLATVEDQPALTELAWRLTAFPLPSWRKPEHIADADGREMMAAIRAGSAANEVFIAERNGVAAGCLHMLEDVDFFGAKHAHISVVATTADAEGSGVGRMLMEHAEMWARQRGHTLLTLNVFAGNERARRFYDRVGYAPETIKYAKSLKV
jgi:GNAT superfamily N-acetyltransferase